MQSNKGWARSLLVAGMACVSMAQAAPPAGQAQSPDATRGVWFEESELGQHQCLQYRLRRTGELVPGTLVVADGQIAEARQDVQEDVLFLTAVTPLGEGAWQMAGLLDVYPYDKLKELKAYGFSVRDEKLYRSRVQTRDGQAFMQTQTYVRCL